MISNITSKYMFKRIEHRDLNRYSHTTLFTTARTWRHLHLHRQIKWMNRVCSLHKIKGNSDMCCSVDEAGRDLSEQRPRRPADFKTWPCLVVLGDFMELLEHGA